MKKCCINAYYIGLRPIFIYHKNYYIFSYPKTSFPEDMAGRILGLRRANERRRYFVMTSLIGWAQA